MYSSLGSTSRQENGEMLPHCVHTSTHTDTAHTHTHAHTHARTHTHTHTHTHTRTHHPSIHPRWLHSAVFVEQRSDTGWGEVGCNVGSVARSLSTEPLMIEKTVAMKCPVAMWTLGKLSLLVFLPRVRPACWGPQNHTHMHTIDVSLCCRFLETETDYKHCGKLFDYCT